MEYSELKNGFKLSKVGLGTNAVGGHNLFENIEDDNGVALIKEALDKGINFIDTADAYGIGRSEEIIGETVKGVRKELFIATKGGIEFLPDGSTQINNNPAYLRGALEKSLKRLQTDYVDIYYIHWPDFKTPVADAVGELERLKEEGKIREIGVSNFNTVLLKEAVSAGDILMSQLPYNMLDREKSAELAFCDEHNISFIPYGPMAFGILGGKYTKDLVLSDSDWRKDNPLFAKGNFEKNLAVVEELKKIALDKGTEVANISLAWLLYQKGIDTVIPGAKVAEQVGKNAQAASITLSDEELEAIKKILP